jgi:hypothetical protein
MADWEANWNRDVLERIVALLFALANLADLAAGASFLRRRHVLDILGHGEVEARAFVIGMASGTRVSADALETDRDAVCLAVRLRALALMLCAVLAQVRQPALSNAVAPWGGRASPGIFGLAVRWLCALPPAPDTS